MKLSLHVSLQVNLLPAALLVALTLLAAGCATPVGVRYLDPKQVQRTLTANVLASDEVSAPTAQIFNRAGLGGEISQPNPRRCWRFCIEAFPPRMSPTGFLPSLNSPSPMPPKTGRNHIFWRSALYAFAFLFPTEKQHGAPTVRSPACASLWTFTTVVSQKPSQAVESFRVMIEEGAYRLPFGEITIAVNPDEFRWGSYRLVNFVQAAELDVKGFAQPLSVAGDRRSAGCGSRADGGGCIPANLRVPPGHKGGRHRVSAAGESRGGFAERPPAR